MGRLRCKGKLARHPETTQVEYVQGGGTRKRPKQIRARVKAGSKFGRPKDNYFNLERFRRGRCEGRTTAGCDADDEDEEGGHDGDDTAPTEEPVEEEKSQSTEELEENEEGVPDLLEGANGGKEESDDSCDGDEDRCAGCVEGDGVETGREGKNGGAADHGAELVNESGRGDGEYVAEGGRGVEGELPYVRERGNKEGQHIDNIDGKERNAQASR